MYAPLVKRVLTPGHPVRRHEDYNQKNLSCVYVKQIQVNFSPREKLKTLCAVHGAGFELGGFRFKLFHLLGKRPQCLVKLYVLAYPVDGTGSGVAIVSGAA